MRWTEIGIYTTNEGIDIVTYILYEAGITGVVIEDSKECLSNEEIPEDRAIVKGYLPLDNNYDNKIKDIVVSLNRLGQNNSGDIKLTEISEEDWAESWKKYYKPIKISEKIVIKPTWEEYQPKDKETIIKIDPGMAFGTGIHETTKMCIKALETILEGTIGNVVIDIGCGSGILSIVSAKLGASKVIGIDIDSAAVKVATENVKLNQVAEKVKIIKGNLLKGITEKGDIIVANITSDVISDFIPTVSANLKPDGLLVLSGIIKERSCEIKEVAVRNDLAVMEEYEEGEWVTLICKER
ncbi:MAG TPA: 50S ribosomal protein L11 methyltransferase [Thermoanaerobacterales bacterium]|nr:50S ribosomal protein L11 methyltransferase [Thermoanaerobacterales bacterium]